MGSKGERHIIAGADSQRRLSLPIAPSDLCDPPLTQTDPAANEDYYEHMATGVKRRNAPAYNYKDDLSARRIQTAWRGYVGKRAFMKVLLEENPRTLAISTIK